MKSEKNWRNSERAIVALWVAVVFLLVLLAVSGCTTVTAHQPTSPVASWDGTNQNSGFIGWSGPNGVITPHARERYNGLIEIYGKKFIPPLTPDYGITADGNVFLITPEALADFAQMNRWRKFDSGKSP